MNRKDAETRSREEGTEERPNPWDTGWRSWLLMFCAEAFVQIVLTLLVGLIVVWVMSRFWRH